MSTFNQPSPYNTQSFDTSHSKAASQFFMDKNAKTGSFEQNKKATATKKAAKKDVKAKEVDKEALLQLGQLMMGGPQPFNPPGAINVGQAPQGQAQFQGGFQPDANALRILSQMMGGQ